MSAKESKNALSRVRNDFTATEEQDLVEFLADYEPSARTSVFTYRELADKPCGSKHSAESWLSRYKRFRPVYDVRIEGFILQNSLPPAYPTDEDEESNPKRVRKKPRLQYERASPPDDETFGDLPISFDHFMKNSSSLSQRDQWIGLNLAVKFLGEAHGIEPEVVYATWERSRDLTITATYLRERDDDGDGVAILHTRDSESRDSGNDASKPAPKTHKRKRTSPPDTPDEDVLPSLPIPKSRRRGRNRCPNMEVVPISEPGERELSFPTSPMAPTDQGRNVEVQGLPRRPEHAPRPDAPDDSDLDSEPSALPPEVHPAATQQPQSRRRLPHQQLEAESDSSSEASLQGRQLVADDEEESDSSSEASVQHPQSQRTLPVPQPANNAEDQSESESSSEPSTPISNARVSPDADNSTEEESDSDSEASVVRPQPQSNLKVREADESDTYSDIDDAGSLPDQAKGARVEAEEALQSEDESESEVPGEVEAGEALQSEDESESEVPREMSQRSSSETSQRSNDLAKSTQHGDDIEDSYIPTQRSLFG